MTEDLREIFRRHVWNHSTRVDGMGRPYGWSDKEIDALIAELLKGKS